MNQSPIRHILFMSALLFVILSSGSLQCALNCYERTAYNMSELQVADCHPDLYEQSLSRPVTNFCHHSHSSSHAKQDPTLHNISGGQALALSDSRWDVPAYRCSDPVVYQVSDFSIFSPRLTQNIPLSQNLKELRSTLLLI